MRTLCCLAFALRAYIKQNWARRWFVLDGTRLSYLRPGPGASSALKSALGMGGGGDKEERDAGLDDGEGGVIGTL